VSNKKQLLDASKRSGTTGGTSGTAIGKNSGIRTIGNAAMINFGNQGVYSSNEERKMI
jgi:hypothetical protein